jgi:hypothetical protein
LYDILRESIWSVFEEFVQITAFTKLSDNEAEGVLIEDLKDFDGVLALNEFLALDLMFEHGFLCLGFEEFFINNFYADELGILSVDSDIDITGHATAEFLLEREFKLVEFFDHRNGDVVIVRSERGKVVHSGGFLGFFGFGNRTF